MKNMIELSSTCPLCGAKLLEENTESLYAMTMCSNEECDYRYNAVLDYEDFKELGIE